MGKNMGSVITKKLGSLVSNICLLIATFSLIIEKKLSSITVLKI